MPRTELVDCHTHTSYSDGQGSFVDNLKAARTAGVRTLACTDHWGRPAFVDCSINEDQLEDYAADIVRARAEFPDIEVVHGLEADWYHGVAADLEQAKGDATFLLGSVHYLNELAIDWDKDMRIWQELGANAVWRLYVDEWCDAATSGLFDSMAHPDLPRLFSTEGYAPTIALEPLWDRMAQAAQSSGVHVEINTAGLTKGFAAFYPAEGLLQQFCAAGCPITVGSDAHIPARIGAHIHDAYAYAWVAGYRSIDVPRADGDWRRLILEG